MNEEQGGVCLEVSSKRLVRFLSELATEERKVKQLIHDVQKVEQILGHSDMKELRRFAEMLNDAIVQYRESD